ncbi:MAG: Tyrosine recombinase XerC [Ignavibacteriaceae bacterium]|nr:Tyrosine recombinase XerC [Ignavibacteriaceae bacterium]
MFLTKSKRTPFYQLVYEVEGKRTTVSTKTKDINEAKKFLASFSIPYRKNNVVFELNNSIILSKFRDEYINYLSHSKSKAYIERSIKPSFKFLIEFTGDILLADLTVRLLDNFINSRFKISQSSASLYYRTIKAALTKAVTWDYLTTNPLKQIKAPKVTKSIPVFISEAELIEIILHTSSPLMKNIFTFAFYTGMRLGEILNMQWDWIDKNQNLIIIKNSDGFTTKSKKERIIPIHQKVKKILDQQSINNVSNYVFMNGSVNTLNAEYVSKQFKKALRSAKLNDDIHFHSLRHSFASNLVQRGVNLYVVKELLGHEDIKTTQVYSHLTQKSLSAAICQL